ncbi:MAG: SMP-30/gluconolactonase/LRE family protein [Gemmataceae bacterium]|jgi:gluconolactonase|nr:SMP-30/gluconolactonase/LRE family protein [Gemmataceae bacterium]
MRTLFLLLFLTAPLCAGPLFIEGAKLEKLWGDGEFTEGPCLGPDGCIYFSDIGNRIMKFDPETKKVTEFRNPSGRSNGLKFDKEGNLYACEGASKGGNRRVSITPPKGEPKTLADKFDGKKFNSPNDLILDAKGRVYFTDPRYGGDEKREIDTESVYRIDPDGKVSLVTKDVEKPNGIVISPDGKTLYVADNNPAEKGARHLLSFPLKEDGTVGEKKILYTFKGRAIDGMAITKEGLVVATAGSGKEAGIYVFNPEGKVVDFLPTPEDPTNCCFAGKDMKTLYITAGKSLYRIDTKGVGFLR